MAASCNCLLGNRSCRVSNAAALWCRRLRRVHGTDGIGSVSTGSACQVLRVLSGGDEVGSLAIRLFPLVDITPPVMLVSTIYVSGKILLPRYRI